VPKTLIYQGFIKVMFHSDSSLFLILWVNCGWVRG